MGELGFLGMTTPEAQGGSALSRLSATLVYEELAQGEYGHRSWRVCP
jgi:alkylation response protein AidB-like acyl-CoA dehydrogenase